MAAAGAGHRKGWDAGSWPPSDLTAKLGRWNMSPGHRAWERKPGERGGALWPGLQVGCVLRTED